MNLPTIQDANILQFISRFERSSCDRTGAREEEIPQSPIIILAVNQKFSYNTVVMIHDFAIIQTPKMTSTVFIIY